VTLRDVAREARVAISTASRALRDRPENLSEETCSRVREAAARLGYERDARAYSLRTGSTTTVGVIAGQLEYVVAGIRVNEVTKQIARLGFQAVVHNAARNPDRELRLVQELIGARVGGIVIISHYSPKLYDALCLAEQQGIATVTLDPPPLPCGDTVVVDYPGSMALALNHLIDLGHTRIGFIQTAPRLREVTIASLDERADGYRQALAAAGLPLDDDWIQLCERSEYVAPETVKRLLDRCPELTAVACCSDDLAYAALRGIREMGLRVPEDISVTGFDDQPFSEFTYPTLTTVGGCEMALAREGVEQLIARIQRPSAQRQLIRKMGELIVRDSTAAPRD